LDFLLSSNFKKYSDIDLPEIELPILISCSIFFGCLSSAYFFSFSTNKSEKLCCSAGTAGNHIIGVDWGGAGAISPPFPVNWFSEITKKNCEID
jgi:hypothetical protein